MKDVLWVLADDAPPPPPAPTPPAEPALPVCAHAYYPTPTLTPPSLLPSFLPPTSPTSIYLAATAALMRPPPSNGIAGARNGQGVARGQGSWWQGRRTAACRVTAPTSSSVAARVAPALTWPQEAAPCRRGLPSPPHFACVFISLSLSFLHGCIHQVAPEPLFDPVESAPPQFVVVQLSATADYARCRLDRTRLPFRETFMFQTRRAPLALLNTGTISLHYRAVLCAVPSQTVMERAIAAAAAELPAAVDGTAAPPSTTAPGTAAAPPAAASAGLSAAKGTPASQASGKTAKTEGAGAGGTAGTAGDAATGDEAAAAPQAPPGLLAIPDDTFIPERAPGEDGETADVAAAADDDGDNTDAHPSRAAGSARCEPGPFRVEPVEGWVEPGERLDLDVVFAPIEADAWRRVALVRVDDLPPGTRSPRVLLEGTAARPLCHFELPASDYLATRRADELAALRPVRPDTRVIEFEAQGIRVGPRSTVAVEEEREKASE